MQNTPQGAPGPNVSPYSAEELFARRLKDVRVAAGVTQQQLADRASAAGHKLFRSQVGKIESGDRAVTIGEAAALADALGVDLAELISPRVMDAHLLALRERWATQAALRSAQEDITRHLKAIDEHRTLYEEAARRHAALLAELRKQKEDNQ